MKTTIYELNRAKEILREITGDSFRSFEANGPMEQSPFYNIGRAIGCIDVAMNHLEAVVKVVANG